MMKKIISASVLILIVLLTIAYSVENNQNFEGRLVNVIAKENSNDRNDVYLKLQSANDSTTYFVDDFFITFIIEQTYKILLSDYIGKDADSLNISLKLENIVISEGKINGQTVNFISAVERIFPQFPQSENSYLYKELNPGTPEQDFYHRYIDVPVSYRDPSKGTFKLYYELCSDFDKTKPTILIPTDGQRSLSQVGWADKYKKMFNLDYNTVVYEYRGMYLSKIKLLQNKNIDWELAYELLNSDNVVEDIERIRKDLLGEEKINILGGSGTAMIGLKYIAKYPEKVNRAFLMSFFKDAKGSSESGVLFFKNFLESNRLKKRYEAALQNPEIERSQLLFLIQRLLYFNKDEVKQMIIEISENNLSRYKKYTKLLGTVDFFIRSVQKYKPWTVVFMYETNIKTSFDETIDINYPFLKIAEPLLKIYGSASQYEEHLFDIKNLKDVNTEILLVGGTLDQVAPLNELERIHKELPNSEFAVFEAYHCLQSPAEAKECRNNLADLFFTYGCNSKEIRDYLEKSKPNNTFIKFCDHSN
ncbi:MAG: alpha/beta hydrolase [Calditrichaeota bacterium]|nr:alpha/beta hydrolase [Calditrichota bacterium]